VALLWANALAKTKVVALPEILPLVRLLAVQPPVCVRRWYSEIQETERREGPTATIEAWALGGGTVLQRGALHDGAVGRDLLQARKAESHGPTLVRRWCHS
jgi:hypothetical protein